MLRMHVDTGGQLWMMTPSNTHSSWEEHVEQPTTLLLHIGGRIVLRTRFNQHFKPSGMMLKPPPTRLYDPQL